MEVNGERKAKYKRLLNRRISAEAIERLEDEGFRGPVRKQHRRQPDEEYDSREYQQSLSCLAYAKDLCSSREADHRQHPLRQDLRLSADLSGAGPSMRNGAAG